MKTKLLLVSLCLCAGCSSVKVNPGSAMFPWLYDVSPVVRRHYDLYGPPPLTVFNLSEWRQMDADIWKAYGK